ncbi:MAG: hypothetical protein H0U86_08515, partial [Chloroflexi bacterium]|nr:hypothetical protein [Chloroflexota bacterium]
VRHLLLSGLSILEIAAETGAGKTLIYNQRQALRKAGQKFIDRREHNVGRVSRCKPVTRRGGDDG